jgi:hypothetical protein
MRDGQPTQPGSDDRPPRPQRADYAGSGVARAAYHRQKSLNRSGASSVGPLMTVWKSSRYRPRSSVRSMPGSRLQHAA